VLSLGWNSVVELSINVSLGLGSEAAASLPPELISVCADNHRLASAYLRDEPPGPSAAGSSKEVRVVHAACPTTCSDRPASCRAM
jgi:hypothetical protein